MNFDDWWNFGWMNDVGYYVADLGQNHFLVYHTKWKGKNWLKMKNEIT